MGADEGEPSETLTALADAYGISTHYWSFFGEHVSVPASTLRSLLGAMGADLADEQAALIARQEQPWRRLTTDSLVVRAGSGELSIHVAEGAVAHASLVLEDGTRRELGAPEVTGETRSIGTAEIRRLVVRLPEDVPLGWHEVHVEERLPENAQPTRTAVCALVVTPLRLDAPPSRDGNHGRSWGLMAQLYSVRSRASWGMGDFADLGELAAVSAAHGADFLLINPIHAAEVTTPIEPSPYLPASRRFIAPLYVRPERIPEFADLAADDLAAVEQEREPLLVSDSSGELIDRDAVWTVKREALHRVFAVARTPERQRAFDAFLEREGRAVEDFALWCAVQEHYASVDDACDDDLLGIHSALTAELRVRLADRVDFHLWLQWIADEQLAAAQTTALSSGMRMGIMHDLAVGVHPLGADVWSNPTAYAAHVTVGAPPDMYNQQGQDWSQPPWLPDALAAQGYRPLRDLLRGLLRHAGALRIDHIIGMFRLWWVPGQSPATAGTYVHYDHEAMIGILVLEAQRAGAVIIGEDLGNVEPWVRDYLLERGVLGTSVLWFENDDHGPRQPESYRQSVLATVTTHDLPPTAGYLTGEHVELRARLGLLEHPVDEEREIARRERETMLQRLRDRWILAPDAGDEDVVIALHRYLGASPSHLLGVALTDAVGERRAQNQPGTYREYPNWRIPLADIDGALVLLDDLGANGRFQRLVDAVDETLRW